MSLHYLVIGAGVLGCSTALELIRRGARVTLLDQGEPGRESSWAGGGILFPLLPWDYPAALSSLAVESIALFPEWTRQLAEESGTDPEYTRSGLLIRSPYNECGARQWADEYGFAIETVDAGRLCPDAPAGPALWMPEVAQVRNPRLNKALLTWLNRQGAEVLPTTRVLRLVSDGSSVVGVETNRGTMVADGYIVAAGAWSAGVLASLGISVPVRPVRGQMLLYQVAPGELGPIVLENGVYIIPRRDGHVVVGSTLEDVGFDKRTTEAAARQLHQAATGIYPSLGSPIMQWAGLRPGSPENIPIIDRHPVLSNLYINTGHYRYGVTLAPASARILTRIILDEPPERDLGAFSFGHAAELPADWAV